MPSINRIFARGDGVVVPRGLGGDATVMNLLIAFLSIAFVALILVSLLLLMKKMRQKKMMQDQTLPRYDEVAYGASRNHRRLTIQTPDGRSDILLVNGRPMLADPSAPPYSPNNVPQIHITFPDEQDEQGRPRSGRVMVVRVGDSTVGLEPIRDEQLPAYEKESSHGFYSIDMNQIGGLKEKDRTQFQ